MLANLSLAVCAAVGGLQFSLDWEVYSAGGDSSRVEFFYMVPYHQLSYNVSDSGVNARFAVHMAMRGADGGFIEEGTVYKKASIPSFEEAERSQRSFVDGFSITAPPGRYRFEMTIAESGAADVRQGTVVDSLVLAKRDTALSLSTLQLGAGTAVDSATGAVSVIPSPARRFSSDVVYVYVEGYNLTPDTSQFQVQAAIVKGSGTRADTVVRTPPMLQPKSGSTAAAAFGVSIDGLEPGEYNLLLELTDLATGRSVAGERSFTTGQVEAQARTPYVVLHDLSERERRYYRDLQYIATSREFAHYRSLPDSGKDAYLAWFWTRHSLTEYSRRMEAAEERYRRQRTPGVKTDRGRIYVKYGEPDAIEQKVLESDVRSREYWHYYNSGYVFVFVDLRGDGNFRLAWTNSKDEPPTGYEGYLSSEEEQLFK